MSLVYIALGSNLGDRLANICGALWYLEDQYPISVLRSSSVYENRAIGMGDAGDFLNAVVEVETELGAEPVLDACLGVEFQLGRTRTKDGWAPRTIDLDLIHFEGVCLDTERLTLPHPRISVRDFVAVPLSELIPDAMVGGAEVRHIVEALDRVDLKKTNIDLLAERVKTSRQR